MTKQMIFGELATTEQSLVVLKEVFSKITEFSEKYGLDFSGEVSEQIEVGGQCATAGISDTSYAYFYIDGTSDGRSSQPESWNEAIVFLLKEMGMKLGNAEGQKVANAKLQAAIKLLE